MPSEISYNDPLRYHGYEQHNLDAVTLAVRLCGLFTPVSW